MKLLRCYIGRYRVLRQLSVIFSPSQSPNSLALDFLVGPNGCGKSTLLQALAEIFNLLQEGVEAVRFPFMLEYELGASETKKKIYVANCDPKQEPDQDLQGPIVLVNDDAQRWDSTRLLPQTVVILTTGREAEWLRVLGQSTQTQTQDETIPDVDPLEKLTDRVLSELPGARFIEEQPPQDPALARVHLIPTRLLDLVTLCGALVEMYGSNDSTLGSLQKVIEDARIQRICGFSITFRLNDGIARPEEREYVAKLGHLATRAVHLGSDRLLYFDLSVDPKNKTREVLDGKSGFDFYTTLMKMSFGDTSGEQILQDVSIFLQRGLPKKEQESEEEETPEPAPLNLLAWLSDGERSFLGRMSLFSMLRNRECLVLLDEPEVHFNDYWKRQIVFMLEQALEHEHSHALITTHSSITLTDVPNDDIIVLHRGDVHTQSSSSPRIPTLAADPSDIIVHVFQAPFAAGERGISTIRRELDEIGQRSDDEAKNRLARLQDQVGPGYWRYRVRRALHGISNDAA